MLDEQRLQDTWYGDRKPGFLLSALERVYTGVSASRRRYTAQAKDLVGKPIVVVGNITAGGTGKTPLVIRLCQLLEDGGIEAAVVSRGYGRKSSRAVEVTAATDPEEGGDEPVLIARSTKARVYVDSDRERAARTAFGNGAQVVIADDGLQRLSLPRIMELCVIDASRGFGNGRLLPAGPLREPLERLGTVDWVVRNGEGEVDTDGITLKQPMLPMRLVPKRFSRLGNGESADSIDFANSLEGTPVTAIAGMGNPERFFTTLDTLGLTGYERRAFPDHHAYTSDDFPESEGTLLMTAKDAVKCARLGLENAWVLHVEADLPGDWAAAWFSNIEHIISN